MGVESRLARLQVEGQSSRWILGGKGARAIRRRGAHATGRFFELTKCPPLKDDATSCLSCKHAKRQCIPTPSAKALQAKRSSCSIPRAAVNYTQNHDSTSLNLLYCILEDRCHVAMANRHMIGEATHSLGSIRLLFAACMG